MESHLARADVAPENALQAGWVGAGKMGAPMSLRLLGAGYPVAVSEPDPDARAALQQAGAATSADLSAVSRCDIVFATLPNDHALRAVVLGSDTEPGLAGVLARGATFVDMSTVSPDASADVAAALDAAGIRYVRAPVSGSTTTAQQGALTVLASGDPAGWDEALPLIRHFSTRQFYLGPGEEARYMKLVINTLVGANAAILAEALSLGASGGLSAEKMVEVINESAVASPLFKYKSSLIVSGDYKPAFTVQQMIKDFTLISDAGRAKGVPLLTAGLILELYRAAANTGHDQDDFFALIKWHSGISAQ
ncbi:NAD(P)-dependent oxidoreductase [Paragemmobacter ruber]|uniref:NAD-binding protein n=1 Tax=Paragemmobacter ruber TaxID=1985673 RepID=A0ABW9Y4Z0_9RHOB|nr:NAD(P)-dependent oxidoreductase [Rhodobacter ruber]NBE06949.1 NAD-binding protein [Rhodobacter ruber]